MKTCEQCQKIDKLDELSLEMCALIDVLERALKCDEFEDGQNTNNLYLLDIIKEKFKQLSIIIENI